MPHQQLTLFDMTPQHVETPPLVRVPSEVYEVRLTFQIDSGTGVMRGSRQVKSALTDELYEWRMDECPHVEKRVAEWIEHHLDMARATLEWWRAPF